MSREQEGAAVAERIHVGFDTFYEEFGRLTRASRELFDRAAWLELHRASQRRIDLYQRYVANTLAELQPWTDRFPQDRDLWRAAHIHYAQVTAHRLDQEVAETFFNAITRKIFRTVGVEPEIEFLENHFREAAPAASERPRAIRFADGIAAAMLAVLDAITPSLRWADQAADVTYLVESWTSWAAQLPPQPREIELEVLSPLFFRIREGYIVGRVRLAEGSVPFLVPVQMTPQGAVVDGFITDRDVTSEVFSSTRPYFFVDTQCPWALVQFLGSFMPEQTLSELYISIAHHRHGKTLIYRELKAHLNEYDDLFIIAPGIRGLVMTVFAMDSYRNVFKVIRDEFEKPEASRDGIMASYRDVFRGHRIGRLADTQEFEHLAFRKSRFSDACLRELLSKAAGSVRVVGDEVVVSHCYIEEKMTPFNLYLASASPQEAREAMVDYGAAIKELAASNVFAGDLLWKNFGVTGRKRLVLYDYDEIVPLTGCRFRRIPPPRSHEDEMAATPYFTIGDADVFPEEWRPFVVPRDPALAAAFLSAHADLLSPEFWRSAQERVIRGTLYIGLPYGPRYPELQEESGTGLERTALSADAGRHTHEDQC